MLPHLREICRDVDDDEDAIVSASADWWPVALHWVSAGDLPARTSVVCRPTDPSPGAGILRLCHAQSVPVTTAGRGKIEDMVVGLDVILADRECIRTGGFPRQAVGPDLTPLFVGSERKLGVITGARLRVRPIPRFVPDALGPAAVLSTRKGALDPKGVLNPGKLGFSSPFGEVTWPR
jgi:FAD/FMN-containing dehydrogenase